MYRKIVSLITTGGILLMLMFTGCGGQDTSAQIESGRYIKDVWTDKSAYSPGEKAVVNVQIHNPEAEVLTGKVVLTVKKWNKVVDTIEKEFSAKADETSDVTAEWTAPDADFTGYAVQLDLFRGKELLDYEMTAVDVSSDWNVFPRYAYLTKFTKKQNDNVRSTLEDLRKYHINGLFFFDHLHRHDQPLSGTAENPDETWENLARVKISKQTVDNLIDTGHELGMKSFSYNLIFGAYTDYETLGIKTEWGIFKDKNHTEFDFHPLPDNWKTKNILLMDPGHKEWQDFYLAQYKEFLKVFKFDGIQVDSLGSRPYDIFHYNGDPLKLDVRYSELLNRMVDELDTKIIFNAVSEYGQQDVGEKVPLDIMFAEVWPWSHTSYMSLKETVDNGQRLIGNGRGVVVPAYMDYEYKKSAMEFNTPGIMYTNAVLLASGGQHLELGDAGMLSSEYYPARTLKMSDELTKATRNYYTFMTAYENLLRGGGFEEVITRSYVNDRLCSGSGAKGEVWSFTKVKEKENLEVLNLINLKDVVNTEWVDNEGKQSAPKAIKNAKIKHYVQKEAANILAASPDYRQGLMDEIKFTKGSDSKGKYVEFELPSLEYWSMVVIQY